MARVFGVDRGSRDCHAQASTTPALSHISSLLFLSRLRSTQDTHLLRFFASFNPAPTLTQEIYYRRSWPPPSPHLANSPCGELGDILGLRDIYSIFLLTLKSRERTPKFEADGRPGRSDAPISHRRSAAPRPGNPSSLFPAPLDGRSHRIASHHECVPKRRFRAGLREERCLGQPSAVHGMTPGKQLGLGPIRRLHRLYAYLELSWAPL
ncbi:hypothetical protein BD779DRAFT_257163 [Infundibulicybe gibba]|nr:hypothetical protein BD779DRAFT_257163 [Infundibulicybe gibba]